MGWGGSLQEWSSVLCFIKIFTGGNPVKTLNILFYLLSDEKREKNVIILNFRGFRLTHIVGIEPSLLP